MLVAAIAGIAALAIGIVIGRGSADDGPDSAATTATTAPVASSTLALETLPPPPPETTTTVRRTTTTTLAVEETTIEIAAPLAGRPFEIVGLTSSAIVRIDVATGATRTIATRTDPNGPPTLLAGDGWALRPSWDPSSPSQLIDDDGTTTAIEASPGSPVFASADGKTFWTLERSGGLGGSRLVELLPSGLPSGAVIETPGYVSELDPAGGVIVNATGGVYRVDGDMTERLTGGYLLAIGATTMVVEECDEALVCGHAVVDRATGERRPLDLAATFGDAATVDGGRGWLSNSPMSPSGDAMLVVVYSNDPFQSPERAGVLDLDTGDFVELVSNSTFESPLQWSPDGELVLWTEGAELKVYDRTDGTTTVVDGAPLPFIAFAVRPTSG